MNKFVQWIFTCVVVFYFRASVGSDWAQIKPNPVIKVQKGHF